MDNLDDIEFDIMDGVNEGGDGNDGNNGNDNDGDENNNEATVPDDNNNNNNRSVSAGGGQGGIDENDLWYDSDEAKNNNNADKKDDEDDDDTEEEEKSEEGDKVQATANRITVNPQSGGKPLSFMRAVNEPPPSPPAAKRMRTRSGRQPPAPNRAEELKALKLNHITNQELLHPKKFVKDPGLVSLAVYFMYVPKFDDERQEFVYPGGYFRAKTASEGEWNGELHSDPIVFNCREEDMPPADYQMITSDGKDVWNEFYKATMRAEDENSFPDPPDGRWRRSRKLTGGAIMDQVPSYRHDKGYSALQPYQQPRNSWLCINVALMNMIHYTIEEHEAVARNFYAVAGDRVLSCKWIEDVNEILKIIMPNKLMRRLNVNTFDVLKTPVPWGNPTIVQLQAKSGYSMHAVGIMGEVVFDSLNKYTTQRTRESLDWSCRPSKFARAFQVAQIQDREKKKEGI